MTRGQAKRIEEIIRNQDVRDPRLTLDAIAAILAEKPSIMSVQAKSEQANPGIASAFEKLMADLLTMQVEGEDDPAEIPHVAPDDVKNEFGNPVATIRIYNTKPRPGKLNACIAIDWCDAHIEPRHFKALQRTINLFTMEKALAMAAKLEAGQ